MQAGLRLFNVVGGEHTKSPGTLNPSLHPAIVNDVSIYYDVAYKVEIRSVEEQIERMGKKAEKRKIFHCMDKVVVCVCIFVCACILWF